jgi:hypothetical protein
MTRSMTNNPSDQREGAASAAQPILVAAPHCETCTCGGKEDKERWNDAVDWLLNSRYTSDPHIQDMFWGIVDGKHTRDEADRL